MSIERFLISILPQMIGQDPFPYINKKIKKNFYESPSSYVYTIDARKTIASDTLEKKENSDASQKRHGLQMAFFSSEDGAECHGILRARGVRKGP